MSEEVFGSGPNIVVMEYCGGAGYRNFCVEAMNNINDKRGAGVCTFILKKDATKTGRFEITVKDTLIHSKVATGKFV